jgi:hypothetical protein
MLGKNERGNRKERVKIMCCVCEKIFTENSSQALNRFSRENKDQTCSNDCRGVYTTVQNMRARAQKFNEASEKKMNKSKTLSPSPP